MGALAVPAGPVPPGCDGTFVDPEGHGDNSQGAAVTELVQHERHQVGGLLEAREWRGTSRVESTSGGSTAIAALGCRRGCSRSPRARGRGSRACGRMGEWVHRYNFWGKIWRLFLPGCWMDSRCSCRKSRIPDLWGATRIEGLGPKSFPYVGGSLGATSIIPRLSGSQGEGRDSRTS